MRTQNCTHGAFHNSLKTQKQSNLQYSKLTTPIIFHISYPRLDVNVELQAKVQAEGVAERRTVARISDSLPFERDGARESGTADFRTACGVRDIASLQQD